MAVRTIKVGDITVTFDGRAWCWESGMAIDADGAARGYAPITSGLPALDDLRNAGYPGKLYGVTCNSAGVPYIQQAGDKRPGYYVPRIPLQDTRYSVRDARRYADSEEVPFIAIPPVLREEGRVQIGDLCAVRIGALWCGAIVGDIGPRRKIGEGSILLAQVLGIDPFRGKPKRHLVGVDAGVRYRIYPGTASSPRWPRNDIQQAVRALESGAGVS